MEKSVHAVGWFPQFRLVLSIFSGYFKCIEIRQRITWWLVFVGILLTLAAKTYFKPTNRKNQIAHHESVPVNYAKLANNYQAEWFGAGAIPAFPCSRSQLFSICTAAILMQSWLQ